VGSPRFARRRRRLIALCGPRSLPFGDFVMKPGAAGRSDARRFEERCVVDLSSEVLRATGRFRALPIGDHLSDSAQCRANTGRQWIIYPPGTDLAEEIAELFAAAVLARRPRSRPQPSNCRDLNESLGFCDSMASRWRKTRRSNGLTTRSTHGLGVRTSAPAATIAMPRRGRSDPGWSDGETIRAVVRLRPTGAPL
jgi:hypothetical protein